MSHFSRSPVSDLLFQFRCTISREALDALEARDADWRRENDALREENRTADAVYRELLLRCQGMEEELSKQTCMNKSMKEDIESLTEKERCLQGKVRCLETDVLNSGRVKKEEVDRVSKEKAVLEAKLQEAEIQLAKQQNMIRNADVLKKEIDDFEFALGQVEFANNKGGKKQSKTSNLEKIQLIKKILREKADMEAEKSSLEGELRRLKERQQLVNRIKEKTTLEGELKKLKEEMGAKKDESERISMLEDALKDQKNRMQEIEKQSSEISKDLKREKEALEAQVREKTEEMKMILKEKMDLEAELCQAKKDKSEDAKRIGLLEKEKHELETEITDKDEVIKVIADENSSMENDIKKLNTKLFNILAIKVEDIQLSRQLYHPGKVGMQTTSCQSQAGCKRKRQHKGHFSEGSSEGRCSRTNDIWEVAEDLLIAFNRDPEICLKAVCVLYREHSSLSADHPVIKPYISSRVIALARYLVNDDPDMRLKKTVADVDQADPLVLYVCRDIAKLHYKELFRIYSKNKHDPSFGP